MALNVHVSACEHVCDIVQSCEHVCDIVHVSACEHVCDIVHVNCEHVCDIVQSCEYVVPYLLEYKWHWGINQTPKSRLNCSISLLYIFSV